MLLAVFAFSTLPAYASSRDVDLYLQRLVPLGFSGNVFASANFFRTFLPTNKR
jgi:hypothetical protein